LIKTKKALLEYEKGFFVVDVKVDTSNLYFADLKLLCGLINLIERLEERKG